MTDDYERFASEIRSYVEQHTFGITGPTPLVAFAQVLTIWSGLAMQVVVPADKAEAAAGRELQEGATREVEALAFRWLSERREPAGA